MAQGLWNETRKIIDAAAEILRHEWPATVRQVFYRLVVIALIENCVRDYRRVGRALTVARRRGLIPWQRVVDRSRSVDGESGFKDIAEYAEVVRKSFRKNYWATQPMHVECWSEKDAALGSVQPVKDEFGITLRVLRGFDSTTEMNNIAEEFAGLRREGKAIAVFYVGDFDPSGECIEEELQNRIMDRMASMLTSGGEPAESAFKYDVVNKSGTEFGDDWTVEEAYEKVCRARGLEVASAWKPFTVRRLAIHKPDIKGFKLPPQRVKDSDPRTPKFICKHGRNCVELDALPPTELRRRLREAIRNCIEPDAWQRAVRVERAEKESVESFAARWCSLQGAQGPEVTS